MRVCNSGQLRIQGSVCFLSEPVPVLNFWFFLGENISALTVFYTRIGVSKVGFHYINFSVQNQSELYKRCKTLYFTVTILVVVGWGGGGGVVHMSHLSVLNFV